MPKEFAKVIEISSTFYVSVPKKFAKAHGIVRNSYFEREVLEDKISFKVVD